jgi:hypothetical protein
MGSILVHFQGRGGAEALGSAAASAALMRPAMPPKMRAPDPTSMLRREETRVPSVDAASGSAFRSITPLSQVTLVI